MYGTNQPPDDLQKQFQGLESRCESTLLQLQQYAPKAELEALLKTITNLVAFAEEQSKYNKLLFEFLKKNFPSISNSPPQP